TSWTTPNEPLRRINCSRKLCRKSPIAAASYSGQPRLLPLFLPPPQAPPAVSCVAHRGNGQGGSFLLAGHLVLLFYFSYRASAVLASCGFFLVVSLRKLSTLARISSL